MLVALAASAVRGQEETQDQLVKALAGVFMVKEGGNIDAARNSMRIFQVLAHQFTWASLPVCCSQPSSPAGCSEKIVRKGFG